jgi:hypothetical protein
MIIDFHLHTRNNVEKFSIEDISRMMRLNDVEKAVIFPMKQQSYRDLAAMNNENLGRKDGKFFPFLRLDPNNMSQEEFAKISTKFSGFKMHPRAENFNPLGAVAEPFLCAINKIGKPVIIHTRKENNPNTDPDKLLELAGSYPNIKFVFGHFANDSEIFFSKIGKYENAFVETSIVSSPMIIEVRVRQIGSEKILFGSDFPYSDQEIELMKIKRARITSEAMENILYKNAERVLSILPLE